MGNKIIWGMLIIITLALSIFYLNSKVQLAGDISEYYGITQSLINHGGVDLTQTDQADLEKVLHKAYFNDPGYYIYGTADKRYPVHFIFYSILATPLRLLLKVFNLNELAVLSLTNVFIVAITIGLIFKFFLPEANKKLILLLLTSISPLAFFLPWPGPDAFYTILVLLAIFLFFVKRYLRASIVAALASWHSQPLVIVVLGFVLAYLVDSLELPDFQKSKKLIISFQSLVYSLIPLALLVIPYVYNYLAFGVLTPWTLFKNGWTQVYGFGMQNVSLQRLWEQFFDLNMGLFWYAPLIMIAGLYYLIRSIKTDKRGIFILLIIILTAFFYQTNPAWHFGTTGFGPSRHALFVLPFLIYFIVKNIKQNLAGSLILTSIFISQILVLSFNGWYLPNFENTLQQSPVAKFVLNNYPQLYNPTPEIFSDRTNHTDLGYITSAVYKNELDECKKAYVLITDKEKIEQDCGPIPSQYETDFDNEFLRKTNYERAVWTTEATLWPDTQSCEDWYLHQSNQPFRCLKTLAEVLEMAPDVEPTRITQVENFPGVWRVIHGDPFQLNVPPGYIIHHYSFTGVYVNYD